MGLASIVSWSAFPLPPHGIVTGRSIVDQKEQNHTTSIGSMEKLPFSCLCNRSFGIAVNDYLSVCLILTNSVHFGIRNMLFIVTLDAEGERMKNWGYVRVSTTKQDVENQRLEILTYANSAKIHIDEFISVEVSSRRTMKERRIEELLERLESGDTLIVSELSRLGRSLGEIIGIVDSLIKKQVRFIAVKQGMIINGRNDIQTKVMITMFGLFAEIERDLLSERTKMGLANAKAKGKRLGRPMGRLGKHKLDGKEGEIKELLSFGVAKAAIARKLKVSRTCLVDFVQKRNITL